MKRRIQFAIAAMIIVALAGANEVWARGFGGFHAPPHLGGMPHLGGGFHPPGGLGGFHAPGGFGGGFHPGGIGGFSPGGIGGFHPGGIGGLSPGGLGGFHPGSLGGVSHVAGTGLYGGYHPYGGFHPSASVGGMGANRVGLNPLGADNRGGLGESRLGGANLPVTRSTLHNYLGMPSDAGLHSVSRAAGGLDATRSVARGPFGGVAAGGAVRGPLGGEAGRGVAVGPGGNIVGGRFARGPAGNAVGQGFGVGPRGIESISAAHLRDGATAVRGGFRGRDLYSADWYRRYPGAWYAAGWGAGYAWRASTWDALDDWFDYGDDDDPIYYDYGTNVVYRDGNVYVDGQNYGTAEQYYQQAETLATNGAEADASTDGQWLPLGVFALCKADHSSTNMDLQLAVNKAGIIRGNYTNTISHETKPVYGSVDKKTQRASWTVGKNTETVMETGLDNLTKDEAPALIHFGADHTQQWILVRIKKDDPSPGAPPAAPDDGPASP